MHEIFKGKLFITIKELAELLGISPRSIYNQLSAGKFPITPKRVGRLIRFDVRDVEAYIASL